MKLLELLRDIFLPSVNCSRTEAMRRLASDASGRRVLEHPHDLARGEEAQVSKGEK